MKRMKCKGITHDFFHAILIYKIPKQMINDAIKFLEETVSIPSSSMTSKKMVSWGLEIYFDDNDSFLKAISRGMVEIHREVYQIYPLVTDLTVHGACAHVSVKTLGILMQRLGKVLCVYCEKKPDEELTNNYRVVIQHPEIPEKIQSWPESSAEIFGNDVMYPITFFCRICRGNGHTRRQCPEAQLQNTLKVELQSTKGDDVKKILYSQHCHESEGFPKRLYAENCTQSKEKISDVPLDLASKTKCKTHCLESIPTTSTEDRKEEIKSNVRKRKSFSYKSLVPPSLCDDKEYFMKFCLGLTRTPDPFEVAKKYPRGIEVLLEQLSSFVRFNLDIMETRRNAEKRFIISIDSLVPKLKYILKLERTSQTQSIEKPEHYTDIKDFSLASNAAVNNSKEVINKIEHTTISKNNIATANLDLEQISKKNGVDIMKTKHMQKPAEREGETSGNSRNYNEFINSRLSKMPKQASNKTTKKVKEEKKPNEKSANKHNKLSMKVLKNTKDKCKGTSFVDMMGSALRKQRMIPEKCKNIKPLKKTNAGAHTTDKCKGTSFANMMGSALRKQRMIPEKCKNIKLLKKLKISDSVKPSKSSCNLKINENEAVINHSNKDYVYETQYFPSFTSNCSNGMNLIESKNNISLPRPSNSKIIDVSKFVKEPDDAYLSSDKYLYTKRKETDKEIIENHQRTKKKDKSKVYEKERSLNISAENTATAFFKVKHKNRPKKSESTSNVSQNLNRIISCSKGVLRQTEMKAFLMHVRNRRNPYKIAEKYSKDVGKVVEHLETIVKKYYLGLRRNTMDDREIDRIDSLCKRLREYEARKECFDSGRSNTQNQASIKTVEKTDLFESHFNKSTKVEKDHQGYFCATKKTEGLNEEILIKNKDRSQTGETNSSHLYGERTITSFSEARHENVPKKPKSTLNISKSLNRIISNVEGVLTSVDMKRFLILVKNKKQPRKIAEKFSKDVDQIIKQLETIVIKHRFEFTDSRIDDREIEWINKLSERLRVSENCSGPPWLIGFGHCASNL